MIHSPITKENVSQTYSVTDNNIDYFVTKPDPFGEILSDLFQVQNARILLWSQFWASVLNLCRREKFSTRMVTIYYESPWNNCKC